LPNEISWRILQVIEHQINGGIIRSNRFYVAPIREPALSSEGSVQVSSQR
jgi:hypothetical protein